MVNYNRILQCSLFELIRDIQYFLLVGMLWGGYTEYFEENYHITIKLQCNNGIFPILYIYVLLIPLQWHHNECNGISYHWRLDCLLNRLFRPRSKKKSKLCIIGLCEGNSLVTSEFPTQRASNVENVSIWWLFDLHSFPLGGYFTNDSTPVTQNQLDHFTKI